MNALKRLMAMMLVGGAGFGLFVACGGNNEEVGCSFDSDCLEDEACEGFVCVLRCVDNNDCGAGEICAPGTNTPENVCQAGSDNNPNNPPNNPNGQDPTFLQIAEIRSMTTDGEEYCDTGDPGPDIYGVILEDAQGNALGWGSIVQENVQGDDNDQAYTGMIDGNPISLQGNLCPEGSFTDSVVSLGCGTEYYIAVEFLGSDGVPVSLDATASQTIRVLEWGAECSASGAGVDDSYSLNLCTDTDAAKGGDMSSCTVELLNNATGTSQGNVSGF